MAYIKNNWVDREGTTRYFETVDSDGAKIFTPDYTQVTELGTPVNSDNMNHIEEGIAAGSFTKYDTKAIYALNDLVTVIEEGSPVIYKSLQDNNIGNALSDSAYWEKISLGGGGGGLEIGDIGFTQMAIDETKGKRRILNGQLIIQEQYVQFTNIVKNSVALNPDLACTESEWQTAVTMSTLGLCGKFVIDDEGGTIRLPKYPTYFIAGLAGIAPVVGNGMSIGLTNGLSNFGLLSGARSIGGSNIIGLVTGQTTAYGKDIGFAYDSNNLIKVNPSESFGLTTDSTKSGIEAQIDKKQITGTYFIQVATGAETEDNIINEIELNNPYSFGDSKYSPKPLNNLSWLKSEGQWNSKAVYPAYYDWALTNFNNGVEGFALSTGEYTDYDVVINPAEETFRLPLLDGSENIPDYSNNTISTFTESYTALKDGFIYLQQDNTYYAYFTVYINGSLVWQEESGSSYYERSCLLPISKNDVVTGQGITNYIFYPATGNGSLYFYVGETVQNANLINAGRIEEIVSQVKADKLDKSAVKAYITETYVNGTSWYRIWSDGWCEQGGQITGVVYNSTKQNVTFLKTFKDTNYFTSATPIEGVHSVDGAWVSNKKTTGMVVKTGFQNGSTQLAANWQACGYIA